MNGIWSASLKEICPKLNGPRRKIFFDLADPEKRTHADIVTALKLITEFEKYFDVILGLNEKESSEVGNALGLNTSDHTPDGLANTGKEVLRRVPVNTLVIHPTSYALTISKEGAAIVEGPFTPKPLITTGAGDHFNAGFCLAKLLGLDNTLSVLTGVATSGFYVRTVKSPAIADLIGLLQNWPQ
jgi:sugar/nucleoside kinase (ribokinase family)